METSGQPGLHREDLASKIKTVVFLVFGVKDQTQGLTHANHRPAHD